MVKPHLMGAQCRCSADEFLVGEVEGHVWGVGDQAQNRDLAEGEEHEAASLEEAHDPQCGEDPRVLLKHAPERKQKTNRTVLTWSKSQLTWSQNLNFR